ncbi:acyl carrier protein [Actinomyces howellii]|uniref:Acyl carrier protein n=1 Tax=Actinomyces howellii TaxID=52771 RepID=A0A448HE03_9ACTO|nr:phosphopantetheine-binding protein [Actinomyces howellii]VEG25744.1 Acyl carrier protein [Actinomyces howellii]
MTPASDVLATIIEITAEEAGVAPETVNRGTRFALDLDIDSLGLLTIATQVEERFNVTLDDSLIPNLPTVGALADLVAEQTRA